MVVMVVVVGMVMGVVVVIVVMMMMMAIVLAKQMNAHCFPKSNCDSQFMTLIRCL